MKWLFTTAIWIFAYVSFSSSAPIFIQNDMALMYPMEYYPAYFQSDFVNLDVAKWFRKAANSVKHFYNYVNNWIFGNEESEPIFGRYPTFKENIKAENGSNDVTTHSKELNVNLPHIRAVEIYKDSNGIVIVKNLNNANGNIQISRNIAIKPGVKLDKPINVLLNDDPLFRQLNDKIAKNPFHWNEKLEKDELFSGAFQNNAVNPELLWHSGIFPFQPFSVFNGMRDKVPNQNQASQNQSNQPSNNSSNKPEENEISSQKIEQSEPTTYSTSTTDEVEVTTTSDVITEEIQRDVTSDKSDTSNDEKKSNKESGPSESVTDIEHIKQNNSNPHETNSDDEADSDTIQASDMLDEFTDEDGDDDTDDNEITESETIQTSSDDDSDQSIQEPKTSEESAQEIVNDGEHNLTIETTLTPSEGIKNSEISEITEQNYDAKHLAKIFEKRNSDESDIAERVLAIIQPSEN